MKSPTAALSEKLDKKKLKKANHRDIYLKQLVRDTKS